MQLVLPRGTPGRVQLVKDVVGDHRGMTEGLEVAREVQARLARAEGHLRHGRVTRRVVCRSLVKERSLVLAKLGRQFVRLSTATSRQRGHSAQTEGDSHDGDVARTAVVGVIVNGNVVLHGVDLAGVESSDDLDESASRLELVAHRDSGSSLALQESRAQLGDDLGLDELEQGSSDCEEIHQYRRGDREDAGLTHLGGREAKDGLDGRGAGENHTLGT
jgi:hypothetical protein